MDNNLLAKDKGKMLLNYFSAFDVSIYGVHSVLVYTT